MKGSIVFSVTNDLIGDQRMHRICTALVENGFNVSLIGRRRKHTGVLPTYPFRTHLISCFFSQGKAFYLEYNFRLFWRLLFTKANIFGAVDLDTILPVVLVAKLRGKKATYDAHEYFTEVPEVYERPAIRKIWKWVEEFSLPKMDAHYTVSNSIANQFRTEYNLDFTVVRNIARYKEIRPAAPGEKFILYQGALNRGRGLEQLIEAMASLDMRLKIAGRGDVEEDLHKQVESMGLQDKVAFMGFLTPDQLDTLSEQAFIGYNLLANDGKSYYYSLANKTFDYMQAGIPVLCSPFPEYLDLAKRHPFIYFSELNSMEIVKAINNLNQNTFAHKALQDAAIAAKEVLNWENEKLILCSIYATLSLKP